MSGVALSRRQAASTADVVVALAGLLVALARGPRAGLEFVRATQGRRGRPAEAPSRHRDVDDVVDVECLEVTP